MGRFVGLSVAVGLGACGPSVVDGTPDAQTSTDSTGSADPPSADGSDGMAGPGDATGHASGDDGGQLCETAVEIGELELLSEIGLGRMQVYDFDADGLADLVGAAGVIAFQRDEGFELTPSPEPVESASCRAGRFDGDELPDLLCPLSGAHLRLYVGGAAETTVDTPLADVTSLETGDMNGDGIDDLVVGIADAGRIETWKGTESGVFELTASTTGPGLAHGTFAALEPPRVDLVVTDTAKVYVLTGDGTGTFSGADSVVARSNGFIERVHASHGDFVLMSWAGTQLETHSGVGLLFRASDTELLGRAYDLSPRTPLGFPAAADLDGDGAGPGAFELVTAVEGPDGGMVEVGCPRSRIIDGRPGIVIETCAAVPLVHVPTALALLPDDSGTRLVVATATDGTWIASIDAHSCLLPKG